VIDRSMTQDTPDDSLAVVGRSRVRNSRCENHLGPRSCATAQTEAGHMTASDPIKTLLNTLRGGPVHI
jgi:hypothetical protein